MPKLFSKKTEKKTLLVDGVTVPVLVYHERRNNVRASIGKKAAILRMPILSLPFEKKKHWEWFEKWILENKTVVIERFQQKDYQVEDTLQVGERKYQIHIENTTNKNFSARLDNGIIAIKQPQGVEQPEKYIKKLLSRVVAQDFQEEIERRVKELNRLYFNVPVENVRLKYNTSNWGSCSAKGNINLSTRLLFAPDDVIDYVIIHELAHRKEMNHSARFWKWVSDAMPDYKKQEKWLRENGKECDF